MGFVLFIKHADGEIRAAAYENQELARVALEFLLDIHRHVGHEIREERGRFRTFDDSGSLIRELYMTSDRRSCNRRTMRTEYGFRPRSHAIPL